MSAINARERLTRLVELAGQNGPGARRALVGELADLLLDWPSNYPQSMREPFEALLEKAVHEVDAGTRAQLAERFVHSAEVPLAFLNTLVFDASPATRDAILVRNAAADPGSERPFALNETALVAAARDALAGDMAQALASRFGIEADTAARVLADERAYLLAVLCKGARASRATFSALALLTDSGDAGGKSYARLAVYDGVAQTGSEALLRFWQAQARAHVTSPKAA
jgi:hypothetical protein